MKTRMFIVLAIAAVLAGVALSYLWFTNFSVFIVHEVGMDLKVVGVGLVGVNTDTDAIHFGKVPKGSGSQRILTLENNDNRPHTIVIKTFGNISGFVFVTENNFVMGPGTIKNVTIMAKVPENTNEGYYDGVLQAIFMNG